MKIGEERKWGLIATFLDEMVLVLDAEKGIETRVSAKSIESN